jgi:hypothetical protein
MVRLDVFISQYRSAALGDWVGSGFGDPFGFGADVLLLIGT